MTRAIMGKKHALKPAPLAILTIDDNEDAMNVTERLR
jgi:hypothetical protein